MSRLWCRSRCELELSELVVGSGIDDCSFVVGFNVALVVIGVNKLTIKCVPFLKKGLR